ncbi:flavodoxin family protein [Sinomicrobium pectinilyticum]|uniref:Flavodoxin family protein n=1 Tax=Sinomicrobium pectinilyticum TaxID=1084421 RepID=A0A3N0ESF5_SINP1|nr:NAD(P)H-dependent oxidoreductase [Sinomicrobium pectinilyticum]RNL90786.1 flavodoxin family protein [Sinomicrobium pectinilyticum]
MKILILLAHPEPESFNAAMFHTAVETLESAGHQVKTTNLYQMDFNPVYGRSNFTSVKDPDYFKIQIEEIHASQVNGFTNEINIEQEKVEWCDLMIWQFPLWRFAPPAILKGWTDRVFASGRFFKNGGYYKNGTMNGKKALLSVTTGSPEEEYTKDGFHGDIHSILRPVNRGILECVGFSVLAPEINYSVAHLSEGERHSILEKWRNRLDNIFREKEIVVGKY